MDPARFPPRPPDFRSGSRSSYRALPAALSLAAALAVCAAAPAPGPMPPPDDGSEPEVRPHVTRSAVLLPLASVLLPGFGQFWHGEASAWAHAGVALGGFALAMNGYSESAVEDAGASGSGPALGTEDWSVRKAILGGLAYQGSGFMSAYSAFRTAVPAFQAEQGRYRFLTAGESLGDVFLSPFRFGHLEKTTTWLPLGTLAAVVGVLVGRERAEGSGKDWVFSADDPVFGGLISYNAGVTEEAAFRGWLLPYAYESLDETWWAANGAQSLLFAAAHYDRSAKRIPWPQALMGWYAGHLTRKNGWTLSEAVFVHFWWDAILLTGMFLAQHETPSASFRLELPLPM